MSTLQESEELNEMYKLYGVAAHNCSNIEYQIAYLLLGPKWATIKDLNPELVTKAYEDLYSKPLGALLKIYKKHFNFNKQTLEHMELVLDKRNHLIHRFFGSYGKKMHNEEVIRKMTNELTELIILFQSASHSLDPEKQ